LRSAALLLRHAGDNSGSDAIERAIQTVFSRGIKTRDLGGSVGTKEFGEAVLKELGLAGAA
jgi:isocitrate/isopropylmalate dehydrogenase